MYAQPSLPCAPRVHMQAFLSPSDGVSAGASETDNNYVVSCSKDGFIRVWDLSTQHCCQTLGGHKAEVWSLDVNPLQTRLVSGERSVG